tara:strand:+ start:411 stop:590 length:180 start_codon:yes stop_codon:yes gene_type:complete
MEERLMTDLTEQEVTYIIEYTGMDVAMEYSLQETPIVYFSRNGNVIDFVTILSKELNTI